MEPDVPEYPGPERRTGYPPASAQEVAVMRQGQEALDRSVRGLHSQLRSLDATLRDYVPRRELEAQFPSRRDMEAEKQIGSARRRRIAGIGALAIVATIQGHDVHVEECRPLRADGTIGYPAGLKANVCDVTFPMHAHSYGAHMSQANVLGLFLYLVFVAAIATDLVRHARSQRKAQNE